MEDPYWEPEGDVSDEDWDTFDEVQGEMEGKGELDYGSSDDDSSYSDDSWDD